MIKAKQILEKDETKSCDNCNRVMPLVIEFSFLDIREKEFNKLTLCEDCSNAVSNLFYNVMEEGKSYKYEFDEIKEMEGYKMSKFKIGDKVRVREDLSCARDYFRADGTCLDCSKTMLKYRGEKATVVNIDKAGDYDLDIDCGEYYWTDTMLEPVKTKQMKLAEVSSLESMNVKVKLAIAGLHGGKVQNKKDIRWYQNGNIITCVTTGTHSKGVGIAKCSPKDKFDHIKGMRIAEIRARADFYNNLVKNLFSNKEEI